MPQLENDIDVGTQKTDLGNSVLMDKLAQVTVTTVVGKLRILAMKQKLRNAIRKFRVKDISIVCLFSIKLTNFMT